MPMQGGLWDLINKATGQPQAQPIPNAVPGTVQATPIPNAVPGQAQAVPVQGSAQPPRVASMSTTSDVFQMSKYLDAAKEAFDTGAYTDAYQALRFANSVNDVGIKYWLRSNPQYKDMVDMALGASPADFDSWGKSVANGKLNPLQRLGKVLTGQRTY